MSSGNPHRLLIERVRQGDQAAWQELISEFDGRLLAFVQSRLRNRATSEDVVQETFLGFLTSLPNYDERTPLESFLFAIAAHRLTDVLRREGRRPTIPLMAASTDDSAPQAEPAGRARKASSLYRSREARVAEQEVLARCLREQIAEWTEKNNYERLMCLELLFVLGWRNRDVARRLNLTEHRVAWHRHEVVNRLKAAAAQARLRDFDPVRLGLDGSDGPETEG